MGKRSAEVLAVIGSLVVVAGAVVNTLAAGQRRERCEAYYADVRGQSGSSACDDLPRTLGEILGQVALVFGSVVFVAAVLLAIFRLHRPLKEQESEVPSATDEEEREVLNVEATARVARPQGVPRLGMSAGAKGALLAVAGCVVVIVGIAVRHSAAEAAADDCRVDEMARAMRGTWSTRNCDDIAASGGEIAGYFLIGGGILAVIAGIVVAILTKSKDANPHVDSGIPSGPEPGPATVRERLEELNTLRETGTIAEDEYHTRRREILAEI